MSPSRILIVRLGAMGDIIHTLPAANSIRRSFPAAHLTWALEPRWLPLLEGSGVVDDFLLVNRRDAASLASAFNRLRKRPFDLTVDFQGLIKSALVSRLSGAGLRVGLSARCAREPLAALFYNRRFSPEAAHIVDRNLELAVAAGATDVSAACPLPPGSPEGTLPPGEFVLASPFAGWASKQWPIEFYTDLAGHLKRVHSLPLVLNMPRAVAVAGCATHVSALPGLIDATRRATAVIGVDSGPLHLAAALGKPGVAIFGPTDPERNGPYGGTLRVLRHPSAATTYKRDAEIAEAMRLIRPEQVLAALGHSLRSSAPC